MGSPKMTEVYKIVMKDNGKYKTLYHGINGKKTLPFDIRIKAEKKMVKDGSGGREYLSGIHCFKDCSTASKYVGIFRLFNTDRTIIKCLAKGLRQKPTNKNVWLADEIFIPSQK